MKKKNNLNKFFQNCRGTALLEYPLIAFAVFFTALVVLPNFTNTLSNKLNKALNENQSIALNTSEGGGSASTGGPGQTQGEDPKTGIRKDKSGECQNSSTQCTTTPP